ncbi:MAG: TauD/TfdA dioxygenase family protein [Lautropia sp.]
MSKAELLMLTPSFAAEIRGMDVANGIDKAKGAFIREALARCAVVVVRGQTLAPPTLVEVSRSLGRLRVSFLSQYAAEGHPEITVVSNKAVNGKPVGIMDAGVYWHSDGSYLNTPDLYTVLYAIEIPKRDGQPLGDTVFSDTSAAYDALTDQMKARIAGLEAFNSLTYNEEKKKANNQKRGQGLSDQQRASLQGAVHPIARSHPITGRKCLFVSEGHTAWVVGLPQTESDELLRALCAHIAEPRFIYRHKWQVGDLVIWDNCATQHLAVQDYGTIPRLIYRCGISGDMA